MERNKMSDQISFIVGVRDKSPLSRRMRVLLALVAVSQCGGLVAQPYPTTARLVQADENLKAAKSLEFVNKVREDLRRNNDDYTLLEGQNQLESAPAPRPAPRRHPLNLRRGNGDGGAVQAPLNLGDQLQVNQSATQFRSATHARHLKSLRVSNLKKQLNRDRDMLRFRDHEDTEDTTSTLPTTPKTSPQTPTPMTTPPPRRQHTPPHALTPAPPAPLVRQRDELVFKEWQSPAPPRAPRNPAPLPDQIDMAHARNPIITRIRLKGRLCQRSLMNIEGPTYDRAGRQLRPAHEPRHARGRLFHQTRAPDLVLPKCCNCCKKSVLGCQ